MKRIGIIAIFLFLVIFSFIINNPLGNLDELWNYSFSNNIADGLVPYKDFNLVQTPFLFMVTSVFLKFIFNGLIVTRILGAILATAILIMVYIVLNKLINNKVLNLFITLIFCICFIPFFTLNYNFLVLLFALIILNYELKSKDEKLLNLNIKKDFLVGILAGLAILTKQSTGLLIAVAYVGYKWLAIRSKEDLITAFKISLSRGFGVLTPIIIFFIYLLVTNSFNDFLSFCLFGVSEFSNSISYITLLKASYYDINIKILAVMVPIVIIYAIIYLIKSYKFDTLQSKNILKLFIFGLASFVVVYPISDPIHFLIGSVILIILSIYMAKLDFPIKKKENSKIITKITKVLVYISEIILIIFVVTLIVVAGYNYYKYITNNEKNHNLNHYNGIIVNTNLAKFIEDLNEYIESEKANGNTVYIVNADACAYNIPGDRYNKYFDLLLKGNLGKDGEENVIKMIQILPQNSSFLVLKEQYGLNWQTPMEVINYIKENYNKVDSIYVFDMYR